ncbi:MAG: hypothetical protein RR420_00995 [Anaerovoracaceae bacterium]
MKKGIAIIAGVIILGEIVCGFKKSIKKAIDEQNKISEQVKDIQNKVNDIIKGDI